MTILEKIAQNAIDYADRKAFVLKDTDGTEKNITWKELDEKSDRLAAYLDHICNTKMPVLVYGHKDPYMIVCFLACVKSGRAYCPVDISVPLGRVEAIVNELKPEIILTTEELSLDSLNIISLESICRCIQQEEGSKDRSNWVKGEDVFYIIFTSGSTGVPKGVQITRDCLDNFISWAVTFGETSEERHHIFLNQAPFSFDLSVMDLYMSLYLGGTLWALPKNIQSNMKSLLASLEESKADVWVSTPSFAEVCLADKKFNSTLLPYMELFLFCGETLSNRTVEYLQNAFPKAKIMNTYGPTESTVAVTEILVTPEVNKEWIPLPVGHERKGTWILIMDGQGNILQEGESGEIVIVGDTVSVGYHNRPELNARVFGEYEIEGKYYRLYHTGDKGYKKDGMLFYCGRIDLQIKFHGYRIEIEDIERNLMKLSDISKVIVMPVYRNNKVKSLTAFAVMKEAVTDAFTVTQKLRSELKEYVPDYMIPKKFIFIEQLPMTNNGKVDRKTLESLLNKSQD